MHASGESDLKVYGIFGFPLSHTVSPAMQDAALDHYGLKAIYFAFERPAPEFHYLMKNISSLILDGFNVTVPYKEAIIPYLDRLDPLARAVGAVNTVKKAGSKWMGYNTDIYGFLAGLKELKFNPRGKKAVILGAGGSARAVVFALADSGVKDIIVLNRTPKKALDLAQNGRKHYPNVRFHASEINESHMRIYLEQTDILINTTKVGLSKRDPLLVPTHVFPKKKIFVYDLIYRPRETKLLKIARKRGHQILNGETMLLHQGAKAFEIWTGKKAPIAVMRKAMQNALSDI